MGEKHATKRIMAFVGERKRLEGDITGKELARALYTGPPAVRLMPGIPRKMDYQGRIKIRKDCDEVFPQIMVGTGDCIKDLDYLLDLGITHIINTSEQDVRIDPTKFAKQGICYKGFICKDMPGQNIKQYFEECAEFIDRALHEVRNGLHCRLHGVQRVCHYCLRLPYAKEGIQRHLGFLQQLAEKDNELRKDRYRKYNYKLEEIK